MAWKMGKKWRRFQEKSVEVCDDHVQWHKNGENYNPQALYKKLNANEDKTCLMTTFVPEEKNGGPTLSDVIFKAGIPVAMICRQSSDENCSSDETKDRMCEIFSGRCLNELRELVMTKRRQSGPENDLGSRLTLIWDNPGRLSPEEPFREP